MSIEPRLHKPPYISPKLQARIRANMPPPGAFERPGDQEKRILMQEVEQGVEHMLDDIKHADRMAEAGRVVTGLGDPRVAEKAPHRWGVGTPPPQPRRRTPLRWLAGGAAVCVLVILARTLPFAPDSAAPVVLRNAHGVEVHVLRVGAAIQRLLVPDSRGELADIALGFDTAPQYAASSTPYFGAVVGRVANRIANATFSLDGRTYRLPRNEAGFPGCLHGGARGFDKVEWNPAPPRKFADGGASVQLRYHSPNGEQGFPGAVSVELTYTLTARDELIVYMNATADSATPLNLAQHAYFNLAGHAAGDVLSHELTLHGAAHVLPIDSARIPTGEFLPVAGTPYDFAAGMTIGTLIVETGETYQHRTVYRFSAR